jgi:sugar lactone lactonase YvrE
MDHLQVECVCPANAVLAEGPCWNAETQTLLWVDIETGKLCEFNPRDGSNQVWELGAKVGCAVNIQGSADVLVGTQRGLARVSRATGKIEFLAHPEAHLPENRFNDGKCDSRGRLWVGSMSCKETAGAGSLYRVAAEGRIDRMVENITISNGLAWSADDRVMYYIDTPTRCVDAFDFDSATGAISNRRAVIRIPDGMGYPDGMCIDAEGKLWVALWAGHCVTRWDPASGALLGKIPVPVRDVTSCCFGGQALDELYITTASRDLDAAGRKAMPLAGGIFRVKPGVTGPAATRFVR